MLAEFILIGAMSSALGGKKKHSSKQSYHNKPRSNYKPPNYATEMNKAWSKEMSAAVYDSLKKRK